VLRNAQRYRLPGSAIRVTLALEEQTALVTIHNQGPPIAAELLHSIFEYGVSDAEPGPGQAQRGQGLFVARTYMAKMGGTIEAQNVADGVSLLLRLQCVA
jgi:K+-sensing histidine kinase KdpD